MPEIHQQFCAIPLNKYLEALVKNFGPSKVPEIASGIFPTFLRVIPYICQGISVVQEG
jgi:hypothetical protein